MTTTVDMAALSAQHTSEAAGRRSRARHRAEWRLKAYGILAISLAGLALGILLSTVITKAASVLFEYYVDIDLQVDVDDAERERLRDPNPRIRVSLDGPVREGLKSAIGRDLSRTERRELYKLLSTDAGLELGDTVKSEPGLVGQSYLYPALLDDEVQMYLKGGVGKVIDAGSEGSLIIGTTGDVLELRFDEGGLDVGREALREYRIEAARLSRAEAARQENAMRAMERDLKEAQGEEEKDRIQSLLDGFTTKRVTALAEAERLEGLAADTTAEFELTDNDPSILIHLKGGWMKLVALAPSTARAVVMEPMSDFEPSEEGEWSAEVIERPASSRNLSDRQIAWIETFRRSGRIEQVLNTRIMTQSDSSNAELAGIWGAMVGSFWTMIVTFG
ncbi:MAG: DUF3333 domain-containing protein, partial [Pseudomonadota bacterium]